MSTLIPEQRRRVLEEILRSDGVVITRDAADKLGVSAMTVRRDIAELERSGIASAVSGGARLAPAQRPPEARGERAVLETEEKQVIAAAAVELIEDGMAIYLDAGTTCEAIARSLSGHSRLTVVTSDFSAAMALMGNPGVRTIHTGGEIDPASGSSAGLFAASTARRINTDLCFLSLFRHSSEARKILKSVSRSDSRPCTRVNDYILGHVIRIGRRACHPEADGK